MDTLTPDPGGSQITSCGTVCHEFIIVLTRILEEGFIRHKNLYEYMKNKKTNFKQNLNAVCDKVIRMILYSPGCENSILGIFVVLFNYAYTVVENRKKKVLRTLRSRFLTTVFTG